MDGRRRQDGRRRLETPLVLAGGEARHGEIAVLLGGLLVGREPSVGPLPDVVHVPLEALVLNPDPGVVRKAMLEKLTKIVKPNWAGITKGQPVSELKLLFSRLQLLVRLLQLAEHGVVTAAAGDRHGGKHEVVGTVEGNTSRLKKLHPFSARMTFELVLGLLHDVVPLPPAHQEAERKLLPQHVLQVGLHGQPSLHRNRRHRRHFHL